MQAQSQIDIGLSAFAYAAARKYAKDKRFAFGTWKIEVLAGFTSAIFLLGVAAMMVVSSIERLLNPEPIHYQEAIIIGILGLAVNLICARVLGHAHHGHSHHTHDHHHNHVHDHHDVHAHKHDLNLKSAYIHVIADAATSVLAIVALVGGWIYGWSWLDPAMGIVGALLVAVWAKDLVKETSAVLLDREMDHPVVDEIREVISQHSPPALTRITDLHVWRVGKKTYACALSLVTKDSNLSTISVRKQLAIHEEVAHVTIEIHRI